MKVTTAQLKHGGLKSFELFGSAINWSWQESIVVEKGFSMIPKLMMAEAQVCVNRS